MGNLAKLEPSVEETSRLYLPLSQVPFARPKITDGLQLRGLRAVCMILKLAFRTAYEQFENTRLTQKTSNRRCVCMAGFEVSWHISASGIRRLI